MSDGSLSAKRSEGKQLRGFLSAKMMFVAFIALDPAECMMLAVDLQDPFVDSIENGPMVVRRSEYLLCVAKTLGVPILATTQNAARLGPIHSSLELLLDSVLDKTSFSCWGDETVRSAIESMNRRNIVLCGVETHICIGLTANDLLADGYRVAVCPDGVGASNLERHKLGMERIRDAGAVPVHTEAVAYEWMKTSKHPKFREVLTFTKQFR